MIPIDLREMQRSLERVEAALAAALGEAGDAQLRYRAAFVAEEVLTNLARHADFGGRAEEVTLAIALKEEGLLLRFCDNSEPFDPLGFPDPDLSTALEEQETGGLGIFLTKQYAKRLSYRYAQGRNVLEVLL